jgi:hypothetical protein
MKCTERSKQNDTGLPIKTKSGDFAKKFGRFDTSVVGCEGEVPP